MVECISKLCHRLLSQGWLNALAIYYTCYNLNILSIPPLTTHIALDTCHNRAVDDTCFNTQCACLSPRSSANTTTDCPTAKCDTDMLEAGDARTQCISTQQRWFGNWCVQILFGIHATSYCKIGETETNPMIPTHADL